MKTLDYPTLKNDLNDFVLSGNESFKETYIGIEDKEVVISAYNDDGEGYEYCCHDGFICTVSETSSHVSVSFIGEVLRKHSDSKLILEKA